MWRMVLSLLLLAAVSALVLPAGCDESSSDSRSNAEDQPNRAASSPRADPAAPPATGSIGGNASAESGETAEQPPLQFPPVATFDEQCARCHGPEGSFYGEAFAHTVEHDLRDMIEQMMRGPAFLDPNETDIAAMAAYHRALAEGEPFVIVTDRERAEKTDLRQISVEASSGAQVTIERKNGTALITATHDGRSTTIRFPDQQWSHAADSSAQ